MRLGLDQHVYETYINDITVTAAASQAALSYFGEPYINFVMQRQQAISAQYNARAEYNMAHLFDFTGMSADYT